MMSAEMLFGFISEVYEGTSKWASNVHVCTVDPSECG